MINYYCLLRTKIKLESVPIYANEIRIRCHGGGGGAHVHGQNPPK